jgi:putative DNA primase/helicase
MLTLQNVARALDGEISAGQVLCPGPGHSGKDRSLAVRLAPGGGFTVHSFAGDDWQTCRDYFASRLGLPSFKASKLATRSERREPRPPDRGNEKSRVEFAMRIWRESTALPGTLAWFYLTQHRKLALDASEDLSHVLRFHCHCPFGVDVETGHGTRRIIEHAPALVALMRDVLTDPRAIQRTRLAPDGTKVSRAMLGTSKGAAIKLDADENVALGLVITEGCETGLAARQVGYRPVWALGSTGAIQAFPVLPGVEGLTIHPEPGQASLQAVHECGRHWCEAGRGVIVLNSLEGSDLNDAIRARAGT